MAVLSPSKPNWGFGAVHDVLTHVSQEISKDQYWEKGWIAVRDIIRYDRHELPQDSLNQLLELEKCLRPSDLAQKARAYVMTDESHNLVLDRAIPDDDGDTMAAYHQANTIAEELGTLVAEDASVLNALLRDFLRVHSNRAWRFGVGLAKAIHDAEGLWGNLKAVLTEIPASERNVLLACGILDGMSRRDPELVERWLDDAVADPQLGPFFAQLQCAVAIDSRGATRLERSLEAGLAPIWSYRALASARASSPISPVDMKRLMLNLANRPGGYVFAADILGMRLFGDHLDKIPFDPALIECGRELLALCPFKGDSANLDHRLGELVKACLDGVAAESAAKVVCEAFRAALANMRSSAYSYPEFLTALFTKQPQIALEVFYQEEAGTEAPQVSMRALLYREKQPIDEVPHDALLTWAEANPSARFQTLAAAVGLFDGDEAPPHRMSWSPIALEVIRNAPDREKTLALIAERIRPSHWSGSLADFLEPYRAPLQELVNDADDVVAIWARRQDELLMQQIVHERASEKNSDESFE